MKRTCLVFVCSILVSAIVPDRAYGWWEYIEKLSGAGPFRGWSLEARLVCLVDPDGTGASTDARLPSPLESITASCKVKDPEVRRGSVDVNMRVVWKDDDPRFANRQRINLTTLAPSISWNLIPNPRWDFVDIGVAGGVFWFSSTEFPSFNGGFIEPIRFDFHATTSFKQSHRLAALIPRLRVGVLGFPGGFEPDAFAPNTLDAARRIPRDWVMNYALFADLEPVLKFLR